MTVRLSKILPKILVAFSLLFIAVTPYHPDEGMYPLTVIRYLDLKHAGLKIGINEIYNPDSPELVNAVVKIGGCTGSFVSPEGLIITNHHCAFGAVQKASTTENNYLENGFLAKTREDEIPAEGITARITVSFEDVSNEVLQAADRTMNISERREAIEKKIKEIEKREEEKDSTIEVKVSEMFVGKSYVLFRYKLIKDIRLVYVPPLAIGEFGGESDNWEWPRYSGDFSFMRAYVAPDGSAAEYSENNVPYKPERFIKVNPDGAEEGDFVFLLGYPAKTFKHQPSQFLRYQVNYQLPYIQQLYSWLINLYEEKGKYNPQFALHFASRIKWLANTRKNYYGKLVGLSRLNLIEKKQKEEADIQAFIDSSSALKDKYGNIMEGIDSVYAGIYKDGVLPLFLTQLGKQLSLYKLAEIMIDYKEAQEKPESEREEMYTRRGLPRLEEQIDKLYSDFYPELEKSIMKKMLNDGIRHKEISAIDIFANFARSLTPLNQVNTFVVKLYSSTILTDRDKYLSLLQDNNVRLKDLNDPYIDFVQKLKGVQKEYQIRKEKRDGKLNVMLSELIEAQKMWLNKSIIPDANRTLRLTYGYIKGYSPSEAVYFDPITTLKGMIAKGKSAGDYKLPEKIRELYKEKDFGKFIDKNLNDVPVAILYNTDTSGGNSGSPVLDAYGKLVGVNFDRPFEAIVNDYAWSPDYSRSIGVDIRYVLWVTQKIAGADFLLNEMGISP
jgi:hypothetical protein